MLREKGSDQFFFAAGKDRKNFAFVAASSAFDGKSEYGVAVERAF